MANSSCTKVASLNAETAIKNTEEDSAWAETFTLVKNMNMQRGRLPEPDHVLDEWTSDTSLDASGVKKMMQTHRDVDEGRLAKMERAFRLVHSTKNMRVSFDKRHSSPHQAELTILS